MTEKERGEEGEGSGRETDKDRERGIERERGGDRERDSEREVKIQQEVRAKRTDGHILFMITLSIPFTSSHTDITNE